MTASRMRAASALLACIALLVGCDDSRVTEAGADELRAPVHLDTAALRSVLAAALPDAASASLRPAAAASLHELRNGTEVAYVTADGAYLIRGDIIRLEDQVNLTELVRQSARRELLAAVDPTDTLLFAPAGETRHELTVLTDLDCSFCRKLHADIGKLNARGIAVRYVPFPRAGIDSESGRKAAAAWCAADRAAAVNSGMEGADLASSPASQACEAMIQRGIDFGHAMGLQGTPLLVLPDGSTITGYLKPAALARRLEAASG